MRNEDVNIYRLNVYRLNVFTVNMMTLLLTAFPLQVENLPKQVRVLFRVDHVQTFTNLLCRNKPSVSHNDFFVLPLSMKGVTAILVEC